jgi:hypothetical protein
VSDLSRVCIVCGGWFKSHNKHRKRCLICAGKDRRLPSKVPFMGSKK